MADNIVLNAGAGGSTLATDEAGAPLRHFQQIKLVDGVLDSTTPVGAPTTAPASADAGLATRAIQRRFGATLSTTLLGIAGIFTQVGQDGNQDGVKYIQAVARSDQASAAGGFVIEEYDLADDFIDANFVRVVASATVSANTTTRIHGVVRARKWRVKYTNGGTAQTTFTLAAAADDIPAYLIAADGTLRIDPTGTTTQPISATALPLPAGAATAVNQLPAGHTVDPTDRAARLLGAADVAVANAADPVRTEGANVRLRTTLAGDVAITLAGETVDVSDRAARLIGQVEGRAAHGVVVAGNPNLLAGRANLNEPTAVADGQAVSLWADQFGRLVVVAGHANPEPPVTVNATTVAATQVIAAPGVGLSLYIHKGIVSNRAAAKVLLTLNDGATARWTQSLAADGGGARFDFGSRGWKLTANTALNVTLDAAGNVQVNIEEYSIAA